jgi:hypothetical protein
MLNTPTDDLSESSRVENWRIRVSPIQVKGHWKIQFGTLMENDLVELGCLRLGVSESELQA